MNRFFTQPWWWCVLPVAVAWVIWLHRSSDALLSVARRRWVLGLRVAGVLCVVLALAGFQWPRRVGEMNVVFLLDRSDSLTPDEQRVAWAELDRWLSDKPKGDRAGVVVFGRDAAVEFLPTESPRWDRPLAVVDTTATDLGAAVRLALATLPEAGQHRLVIMSDGNETQGRVLDWLPQLRNRRVSCDVLVLGRERPGDGRVERVEVPARVGRNEPFDLKLWVYSPTQTVARLRLYANDQLVAQPTVELAPGKNLFRLPQRLEQPGFYHFEVLCDVPGDFQPRNNRGYGFVMVEGPPRVLVLHTTPEGELGPWLKALGTTGAEVTVRPIEAAPPDLAGWYGFDAVVLENVAAGNLPMSSWQQLQRAVADLGVGLICVGGDQSFTAGGYRGTPLAELLPVSVELEQWRPLPVVALMLVLDRSGSMLGEKLEMAKRAAMASILALGERDWVGVLAFDTRPYEVAPLQPAGQRRTWLAQLARVQAEGGTSIYPALEEAYRQLARARAHLKHCVVLTDGITQPGEFEALTRQMRREGITVSAVGVGEDFDRPFLEQLAAWGGGRFYAATDPAELPQLFLRDTALLLRAALVEETFEPRRIFVSEPLTGLPGEGWPKLHGYVVTAPRARAETPLRTHQGDPLLAHWQFGLGRVVAFTSDVRARWARDWLAWPQFSQFWAQLVQWSLRRLETGPWTAQVRAEGETIRVWTEWDGADEPADAAVRFEAVLVRPDGSRETQEMRATAPGLFEARFTAGPPGAGAVQVRQWDGDRLRAAETLGFATSDSPELARTAPNRAVLTQLAEETGGMVLAPGPQGDNPFGHHRQPTWAVRPLWPTLLRLALFLFVLDIALRRLHFEREDWLALRRWMAQRLAWPASRGAARGEPVAEPALASLLARKEAVRGQWAQPSGASSPAAPVSSGVALAEREPPRKGVPRVATGTAVPSAGDSEVSSTPVAFTQSPGARPSAGADRDEAVLERLRQARLRARQKLGGPPNSASTA
ncbi:MAG: VWA domain-containing protein [Limisphaera sp.]